MFDNENSDNKDKALILRIKNHDNGAIEELYTRIKPFVLKSVLAMGASPEEAEDIVIDSIYQLYNRILDSKLDYDHINIVKYLSTIARNRFTDELRKKSKSNYFLSDTWDEADSPLIIYEKKLISLEAALNRLSVSDQELIHLRYFKMKSYQEIAIEKDLSPDTIKQRISRIQFKLKNIVSQIQSSMD